MIMKEKSGLEELIILWQSDELCRILVRRWNPKRLGNELAEIYFVSSRSSYQTAAEKISSKKMSRHFTPVCTSSSQLRENDFFIDWQFCIAERKRNVVLVLDSFGTSSWNAFYIYFQHMPPPLKLRSFRFWPSWFRNAWVIMTYTKIVDSSCWGGSMAAAKERDV
jgi:hypothetical protein